MDQEMHFHGVADVGGRGKRHGEPGGCNNVHRIGLYVAHPGHHNWGPSWEVLLDPDPPS